MTPIYRQAFLYEMAMVALYGRNYPSRYKAVADLIPYGATVLDVCCGPGILFDRYLRHKQVRYTGLDLSETFIRRLRARGAQGHVWNVRDSTPLPPADYVIMHASLCHFLPDARPVLERMLRAAQVKVIVSEPIRNLTSSKNTLVAALARLMSDPGDGQSAHRFTEESIERFFASYASQVERTFLIPGGRERVVVLNAAHSTEGESAGFSFQTR